MRPRPAVTPPPPPPISPLRAAASPRALAHSLPRMLSTAAGCSQLSFPSFIWLLDLSSLHAPPSLTPSPIAKTVLAHPQHPFPLVLLACCSVMPGGNPILGLTSSTAESSSPASVLPPSHVNSSLCQCHPVPLKLNPRCPSATRPLFPPSLGRILPVFLEKVANAQLACLSSFPRAPLRHPVHRQTFLLQVSFANPSRPACICVLTLFVPILIPSHLLSQISHLQYGYGLLLPIFKK